MNFGKFNLYETPLSSPSSASSISLNESDDDDDNYKEINFGDIFKHRIKSDDIKKTYDSLTTYDSSTTFKFVNIDDDKAQKLIDIRNKINKNELNKKDKKTLYETDVHNDTILIETPTYSELDMDKQKYTKIYTINKPDWVLQNIENIENDDVELLFLSILHNLMKYEYDYQQKAYDLLQNNNTIDGMIKFIKDTKDVKCNIVGEEQLITSCNEQIKNIKNMKEEYKTNDYKVIVPKIYESNMNDTTFFYDNEFIYYFMTMDMVDTTNMLQNLNDCENIKKMVSVIDTYFMINGISHNDFSTKGNVFVNEKDNIIYIIDFGVAGNYVYNASKNTNLSPNINSLNITCTKKGGNKTLKRNKRNKNKQSKNIKLKNKQLKSKKSNNKRKNSHKTKKMKK